MKYLVNEYALFECLHLSLLCFYYELSITHLNMSILKRIDENCCTPMFFSSVIKCDTMFSIVMECDKLIFTCSLLK